MRSATTMELKVVNNWFIATYTTIWNVVEEYLQTRTLSKSTHLFIRGWLQISWQYCVTKHIKWLYGLAKSTINTIKASRLLRTCLLGLYSLSGKTSYRQISWSLEAAILGVIKIVSLWNLTGISAALLPRCLLNFRAIGKVQTRISWLRDFTRSCGKTSYRLVNRGPESIIAVHSAPKLTWNYFLLIILHYNCAIKHGLLFLVTNPVQ